MNTFLQDTLRGLQSKPKFLDSKYFYNEAGDNIFQEIMSCPEYYLTRCELEIFTEQAFAISKILLGHLSEFDVIELGPGDALKSKFLLKQLRMDCRKEYIYYPIDISTNIIGNLEQILGHFIPNLKIYGIAGDYFNGLKKAVGHSSRNKLVMFLGSNIGNMSIEQTAIFCRSLRSQLSQGDMALIGFDLKKDPHIILNAYNDKAGITKRLNRNLLKRMNEELGADFSLHLFEHYPTYDPGTGSCKSYLISQKEHYVSFGNKAVIQFCKDEEIHTETSQKFTVRQTEEIAYAAGFKPVHHFFDRKKYFLDAVWMATDH